MPMLAVCSSLQCDYQIQLQDPKMGTSVETPQRCPKCGGAMIDSCPSCRFPLIGSLNEKHLRCEVCHQDIRKASDLCRDERPQLKD